MGFDTVKLEKGMYRESGKTFAQVLESLDPSENYKGTDAFQRQLKRFDIRAKGAYSDPVEKFFRTMESSVLFPEYIARAVRQGMEDGNVLPKITATTTTIDSMDYRSVYSVPSEKDKKLMQVAEGASIPATEVRSKSNLVRLHKRGRMLVASYEAIRFQKLDLFSVTLRQIGAYIQRMHVQDAVDVLVNGDGNANAAAVLSIGADERHEGDAHLCAARGVLGAIRPVHAQHSAGSGRRDGEDAESARASGRGGGSQLPGHRRAGHAARRGAGQKRVRSGRQDHRS